MPWGGVSDTVARALAYPTWVTMKLFGPVITVVQWIVRMTLHKARKASEAQPQAVA